MSDGGCLSEELCSIYVDRELDARETRRVETHLAHCAACAARVADLAAEAIALRAALQDEALAPVAPARRSLALGSLAAVAGAFVALSSLGWLLENRQPGALEWLDPRSLRAPFALFFELWSALAQSGDALAQVVVPLSALIIAGMLISAAAGPGSRNGSRTVVLLLALALWPIPASAIDLRYGEESVTVPAGEVVDETLIVQADTVTIDGTLRGDLIAVADRVVVSGLVEGNLVTGARRIEVSGRVAGSVIAAGERVRVSGAVERNVYAAADQTTIADAGQVGQDLLGLGDGVEISGRVARDATMFGTWIDVRGEIGRDLAARVEQAEILASARIGGDLRASYADEESAIRVDPAASIGGETTIERAEHVEYGRWDHYASGEYWLFRALAFAAAFAFGMAMFRLTPWLFASEVRSATELFRLLGIGLAALVLVPVAIALVALTVVGIPLAVLGLFAFAAAVYSANIAVGALIGASLLRPGREPGWRGFARPLAAGLAVVFVALALPYLGGVLRLVALLLGLGLIVERSRARVSA